MIQFQNINWLYYGLIALLVISLVYFIFSKWKQKKRALFAEEHLHQTVFKKENKLNWLKNVLFLLAVFLLFIALANPLGELEKKAVKRRGADIIFCIDISSSMLVEDIAPNRLEKAKKLISDIVANLKGDRIGIVAYAGASYPVLPITNDYGSLGLFLPAVTTTLAQTQGTDTQNALDLASKMFSNEQSKSKIVVLLSDGENHEELNNKLKDTKVIAVGFGTKNGGPIPIKYNNYVNDYKKDDSGNRVVSKRNLDNLKKIASANNGIYIEGNNSQSALKAVISFIDGSDKSEQGAQESTQYKNNFYIPAIMALILFFVVTFAFKSSKKTFYFLFFIATNIAFSQSSIHKGLSEYDKKNYKESIDWLGKSNHEKAAFFKGNAHIKNKEYEKALDSYNKVNLKDKKEQSIVEYNKSLAHTALKQGNKAIESLKNSLRLDPKNEAARKLLVKQEKKKKQQPNKDQNKPKQEEDKKKEKQKDPNGKPKDKPQDQKQEPGKLSKQEAERMLKAIENEEKKTQKDLVKKNAQNKEQKAKSKPKKDW